MSILMSRRCWWIYLAGGGDGGVVAVARLRLIAIDYAERDSLAVIVLSLGGKRVIALSENAVTNQKFVMRV